LKAGALTAQILFIAMGFNGLGHHKDTIKAAIQVQYNQMNWLNSLFGTMGALGFLKISIALSLLRLSKSKWYSISLWGLIG
jgi:hypothetical protein